VTDANVVLGRLLPEHFPHLSLDVDAARTALTAFGDPVEAATGFLTIAVDQMAGAIRRVTVARGHDVRDHALVAFGGAGGGHAAAVARALGMDTVIVPPLAGVLSASGLGLAQVRRHAERPVAAGCEPEFPIDQAEAALIAAGHPVDERHLRVDVRTVGQDEAITLPWSPAWQAAFHEAHRQRYGFARPDAPVELVTARVEAVAHARTVDSPPEPAPEHDAIPEPAADEADAPGAHDTEGSRRPSRCPVYVRSSLRPGARLSGPALIVDDTATTVVEHGWSLRVDGHRQLILHDDDPGAGDPLPRWPGAHTIATDTASELGTVASDLDPVALQVLGNRFMAIAEQMGEVLRRTAHSTNIKERLDFSCAVFDGQGLLIANAPHIPVHLGAVGETVRWVAAAEDLRAGDAWLSNDPYHGGSHLPDLTVVSPVFAAGQLVAFVANRAHHADVGGKVPGSMPAHSATIHDEGACIERLLLVRDGRLREDEVIDVLAEAGTRRLPERLGDLAAQVAANSEGTRLLTELIAERGVEGLQRGMEHVLDEGEAVMADVVSGLADGAFEDGLDDGSRIKVSITCTAGRALIDFAGTSDAVPGNRNAPEAVTRAAVLYVFRTLAARSIPLNDGCARVLEVAIPEGSLLSPRSPAAVVGGNVETSQRVVDVLYGALAVLAASQGTMNNLTFGDATFGYYETICGGAGAGFGFDGTSAVHTHMTNTRITDPEVLELRCPVVVERFAIRAGSGGAGVWRGGDGVVRELRLLAPLDVSLLAERRVTHPFGLRAGPGATGDDDLGADRLVIRTPGGGGYSPTTEQWSAMSPAAARALFREGRWTDGTAGIARSAVRAHLVVVAATHVEALLASLAEPHVLHRGAPGDPIVPPPLGPADVRTDLSAYTSSDSAGKILRNTTSCEVGPDDVVLLIRSERPESPQDGPAVDFSCVRSRPGSRYLGNATD